jgi:glucokinase
MKQVKVLGVDIGGTKIMAGLVTGQGECLLVKERATEAYRGKSALLEHLENLIDDMISHHQVDAIGIGSAGRIDTNNGTVYFSTPNLPDWTGVPIRQHLEARFQIPIAVDNDVNVAGIGEKWMGAGKPYDSVVCLTLGTGVAAAVYVHGKLIRGKHWSTGEIGHMILYPHGRPCNCGQLGCMEQYVSGTSLYRSYNDMPDAEKIHSGKQFFERLRDGDVIAMQVMDRFTDDLAISMVSLCNIYDPEAFIIGGGLIETRDLWWDAMTSKIRRFANSAVSNPLILPAINKNQAGMLGAAKIAIDYVEHGDF